MLPKPDKSKKTKTEQLDLVETISKHDSLLHRRRYIILTLIVTSGLSLAFMTYRYLTTAHYQFSLPHLSLPSLSTALKLPTGFDHWSVYVKSGQYSWSQRLYQLPPQTLPNLNSSSTLTTSHSLATVLPSGVEVKEIIATTSASYLITVPDRQILLYFEFPETEKSRLPQIVESIYWDIIRR